MPWWSWVLIWVGLVLVLLATLALIALWLYRKLMALLAEFERLSEVQEELVARAEALVAPYEARQPAVARDRAQVERERRTIAARRAERKERRRDERLAHARRITTADPMQYAHLARKK